MDTIQDFFEEYIKSYDRFTERDIAEMRLCFFAGAAAMHALTKDITRRFVVDDDLKAAQRRTQGIERDLSTVYPEARATRPRCPA